MSDAELLKALEKFSGDMGRIKVDSSAAVSVEVSSEIALNENGSEGTQEIFHWIEEIVGSQFTGKGHCFRLLEFELGRDDHDDDDDLIRYNLSQAMSIPLKVVYMLDDDAEERKQLIVHLPSYFYDFADQVHPNNLLTVHTHETYFYSTVVKDINNFLEAQGVEISLAIPKCFYVKHEAPYEARPTPALIENVMKAKTLLALVDPRGEGFNELEAIEDVGIEEGLAVMNEMGKLHAVTWCMEEKSGGRKLAEMWPGLLSVTDQAAIHERVMDACFEFFTSGLDSENQVYTQVCYRRPEIERVVKETVYSEGPNVPNALVHMMIGGPNLYFRRNYTPESNSNEFKETEMMTTPTNSSNSNHSLLDCCITSWSLATTGNPILDLAFFTTVSLTPVIRQQYIDVFLDHYWQAFVSTASLFNLLPKVDIGYMSRELQKFQIWSSLFMIAAGCEKDDDGRMKEDEMRDVMENIIKILDSLRLESTE